MAIPTFATLAGTVKYSDATTLFDGWCLVLLGYPTGSTYTFASVNNQLIPQRVADRARVRIQAGVYDQSAHIYFNSSLQPPNTKYAAFFYDNNDNQLGSTALFTVNVSPFTIAVPSMTVPTAPTVPPVP